MENETSRMNGPVEPDLRTRKRHSRRVFALRWVIILLFAGGWMTGHAFAREIVTGPASTSPFGIALLVLIAGGYAASGLALVRGDLQDPVRLWRHPVFRGARIGACLVAGWFLVSMARTQYLGIRWGLLVVYIGLVTIVMSLPVILLTLDLSHSRRALSLMVVVLGSLLLAESTAGLEEHLFQREMRGRPDAFDRERWWPNDHHQLLYHPPDHFWAND